MRPVGFSTGALAKGDFRAALAVLRRHQTSAVELSALREHELLPLIDALPALELAGLRHVSVHAPDRLRDLNESSLIELLRRVPPTWPIVVHPGVIATPRIWRSFGRQLCIENMDARKTSGRTVAEMAALFAELPEASFCLDAGHARQVDPTMATALRMLAEFGERLVQIHLSEVGEDGQHLPVSAVGEIAFRKLSHRVPNDCPLVIEAVVSEAEIEREQVVARELFNGPKARAIA